MTILFFCFLLFALWVVALCGVAATVAFVLGDSKWRYLTGGITFVIFVTSAVLIIAAMVAVSHSYELRP